VSSGSIRPDIDDLHRRLSAAGAAPVHRLHMLRQWLSAAPLDGGKRRPESFLPASVRADLPAIVAGLDGIARIRSRHPSADGSIRLLVELGDGRTVESVLLPRDGLCVSTQVGCAVGCTFCMTGRGGLERQLGSAEIVAQVAIARRERTVRKVVFMGMGEPAHNLRNVLDAIVALATLGGIAHKNLVFSTVGDENVFDRLLESPVRPALALSLHTTRADLRERLLPKAAPVSPARLVELGDAYARASGYPMQVQWTLIDGVNDGDDEIDAIASMLAGRHGMLNLIPFNRVDGLAWRRPDPARTLSIARELNRRGVLTRVRQSAGQDVDGGCGQLRTRAGSIPLHTSR
jgi:23S rRNA (adenine2503-C2)-methyltransferase